jgi:hypothetical protein
MNLNKNYLLKLRHVLPVFSLVAWGSVLALGLIRQILFLGKYPMLELDEDIWNFWIPALFPWIPVLLWLKPKFDLLISKNNSSQHSWPMQVVAWIIIAAMLLFSQNYLTTSNGKLLEVENVKEIRRHDPVRYYRIRHFSVYRYMGGVQYAFRRNGRYNQNLDIDIYFVNPILTHKSQHIITTPLYWYGVKFHKQISNWSSNVKKEMKFRKFLEECIAKMNRYEFKQPDHFENKPESKDRKYFRLAVQNAVNKPVNDTFLILQPKSEPYELRNGHKISWLAGSFFTGVVIYMLTLIRPHLKGQQQEEEFIHADPNQTGQEKY